MFYFGCQGNQGYIATRYETDANCPNELLYQMWTQYNLSQRSYKV